ncbi:energy transducer TonB [Geobacter sp. FeAm09]|uniref:energy transducer TonB n=1 Tax=Geobacter sp. FeAm09 TaxID=2597769 RepID=UPI0011F05602|nr:energy transducer TonB [Geobacter sp. FeAm09]QEM68962.1 energy transducer TonB [Geobacter sp. FeAm09]
MRYPGLARRMGWSGTLLIEFVVQKDGSADMVRIVSSSGVPLLDRDARETVLKSAPFPKPPVSATLRFPMEYKLEN